MVEEVEVGVMAVVVEMMAEAVLMGMAEAAPAVAGRGRRARWPPLLHNRQDAAPTR